MEMSFLRKIKGRTRRNRIINVKPRKELNVKCIHESIAQAPVAARL